MDVETYITEAANSDALIKGDKVEKVFIRIESVARGHGFPLVELAGTREDIRAYLLEHWDESEAAAFELHARFDDHRTEMAAEVKARSIGEQMSGYSQRSTALLDEAINSVGMNTVNGGLDPVVYALAAIALELRLTRLGR